MLQVTGRAIFQKERADEGPSGEPETDFAKAIRKLKAYGRTEKALTTNVTTEE